MKHAIRALGWATAILWIFTILFSGTVIYSAMQIKMSFEEEPQITASNGIVTMSIPFSISNGGFYDISELNITTRLLAENETYISSSTTLVPLIPRDSTVRKTHDIALNLNDLLAKELTYLLFNDSDLNVNMFVALIYAHTIPLKISSNLPMSWGAPLYNLTINGILPLSPQQVNVFLSFENHAFFGLNGTVSLKIVDESGTQIGSGTTDISVPPRGIYDEPIPVNITGDLTKMSEVHIYFITSLFSFGPMVIDVG